MNNQDTNISQYNGLLKEQEKPQMGNAAIPEPILGNTVVNQKPNDFFPSLEDQPLNTEVPINNISGAMPMTPPPIDMSTSQNMPGPVEMPQMNTEPTPPVAPEMPQFGPAPAPTPVEMPQMNTEPTIPAVPGIPQFGPVPAPTPVEMPKTNAEPTMPNEPVVSQPQTNNTVLATTILKDILPLLEHSGYKIILEESDTPTEHLVTFKIQK